MALAIIRSWLSETFLRTSLYTFFFSADEALFMKSEKLEVLAVFFLINFIITINLAPFEQGFKVGGSIFFTHMIVNTVYIGFVSVKLVISILK